MQSLSIKDARKLVLACQGIHREGDFGARAPGVIRAVELLSYIQIDTISVVERAHHHTLWNRVKHYRPEHLDKAIADRKIFEYWSHAAAYLPMRDYRYSLPRKNAIAGGEQHWYEPEPKQMVHVLERIRQEGPLQASDFEQERSIKGHAWGDQKPAKRALMQLFMEGQLMISRRQGFQKIFDLSERVLPDDIDTSTPSEQEFFDHLIERYLDANGIGTAAEIAYLRKGIKAKVQARCQELIEDKQLIEVSVKGKPYYALSNFETALAKKVSRQKVKILSPFDNLLIQRQRMQDLFDFDYQIECYVTAKKRKHGYFVLPVLQGQNFAGRLDAKIDRKTGVLTIISLYLENSDADGLIDNLKPALRAFMEFNGGHTIKVGETYHEGKPYRGQILI